MIRAGLAMLALAAGQGTASGDAVRFVACPVYRDTDAGAKSGCWLADDPASGVRYDVTLSPTKPDWNRAILVEGRVARGDADPCGGVVLAPARVSVLDDACTRHMLPAEGFGGRRFTLPPRNVRPLYEARTPPPKPWAIRQFAIPFDFGQDFVVYQLTDYYLDAAINYALDVQPAHIIVTGHAATRAARVSGRTFIEPATLARARAQKVADALTLRGIARDRIAVRVTRVDSVSDDAAFDGLPDASRRRVDVLVTPD